ncbi:AcrR family transcriptional regulator [Microbacterium resistens]|uniref:AcrR family transcriptional regulator n=1 Tax=Microbacterium resistens TaxID=156977 RepID=A0ABU1S8E8_9MICO|nr:helix-turn-helix domain-containing protein [Microbacterium resistens]MDR6865830.1 AcrR family transcriptional regulator [Microbacterium resistens]
MRKPRADALRSRSRILSVARDLPAQDLRLNEIARDAGVGVGTVYRHFPTVQSLLEALAIDALQDLHDRATRAAADPDTGRAIEEMLRSAVELQLSDDGLQPVLMATESETEDAVRLKVELFATLEGLVARARREGVIRPDLTVARLQHLVCGIEHAVRIGERADVDLYLDVVLRGLRPA